MNKNDLLKKVSLQQDDDHDILHSDIDHVLSCAADVALTDPMGFSESWAILTQEALRRSSEKFKAGRRG